MLGYQWKREAENLREIGLDLTSNSVCAVAGIPSSTRKLNMIFGARRSGKKSTDLKRLAGFRPSLANKSCGRTADIS
jgi:hypothetical protein